ncbi:MAG: hypothetical protein Q8O91_12195 [Candidatus Aminicenantes bacterium]|nr:hypothetical protein [Candidatus Aminicenantes bacterium]
MAPRAKPGALTRNVSTRLSAAETDPHGGRGPCRRPGRRGERESSPFGQ